MYLSNLAVVLVDGPAERWYNRKKLFVEQIFMGGF